MKTTGALAPIIILIFSAQVSRGQSTVSLQKPLEIETGYSFEQLGDNYADWHTIYLEVLKKFALHTSVYGMVRQTERFSLKDQEILAGSYFSPDRGWIVFLEGSVSPSHNILATWTAMMEVQRLFAGGWILHLGGRRMKFSSTASTIGSFTVERYWDTFRSSYTFFLAQVDGSAPSTAHRVWGSVYYDDLSAVNIALSIGKEVENVGPAGGVLTSKVLAASLFGKHWLTPSWAIAYELTLHQQGDFYTRRGIRIGVRYLF